MTTRLKPNRCIALVLALSLIGIAACGKSEPAVQTPETPAPPTITAYPEPPSETPTPTISLLAPLTGMPVEQQVTTRPIGVMINNLKPARPQSGMTQADTVWEFLAEGGITRFIAIFQSKEFTDPIGPIRSIRPYFIKTMEFYGAVIVHAGASNDAFAILQRQHKEHLDEITNAGAYFYRDKSRKAPHNVYSTLEKLRAGAEKRKYPNTANVPLIAFDSQPSELAAASASAQQVEIKFMLSDYKVSYTYDSAQGVYARFINGERHYDKNNDQQLTATNLVVLSAKHDIKDSVGRLVIDLDSGGEAVLIQSGKAIPCRWERKEGDVIRLMKDGKELPFLPGVTYYHVVPSSSALDKHVTYS